MVVHTDPLSYSRQTFVRLRQTCAACPANWAPHINQQRFELLRVCRDLIHVLDGWKVFEAPGVEPVFTNRKGARVESRMRARSDEIWILDLAAGRGHSVLRAAPR